MATYADILARRSLDAVDWDMIELDAAQVLMHVISNLGAYANARKKFDRGDINAEAFNAAKKAYLGKAKGYIERLIYEQFCSNNAVVEPHPEGIDLGEAITNKFNEVSERVGSTVYITANSVIVGGL